MLTKLYIQNYAIIEKLDLNLDKGLTIITGETGAGKSILLGALGLIMGKRADSKVLFDQSSKCVVEADFEIKNYQLQKFFEENDLDYEDTLIIRREIASSGKSRAFINDTPSTLTIVKELTSHLIDMHQQFDTLGLQQKSYQITLLDAIAKNQNHVSLYQEQYKKYQSDKRKLSALLEQEKSSNQEHEFILFQLKEFDEVALIDGEEKELTQNLALMESAETIKALASKLDFLVSQSDTSITQQLTEITNGLSQLDSTDETLKKIYERLLSNKEELQDITTELEGFSTRIDFDPNEIHQLRERQDSINKLLSKHRVKDVETLISIKDDLQTRADAVSDLSGTIKKLTAQLSATEKELLAKAKKISEKRKKAIPSFEKKVHKLLSLLSMGSAQLKIKLESDQPINATGSDEVEFTFASNVGSTFQSIKDVASGGEMSRLSLCIKSIVADAVSLPCMIFDEIDTGVSGEVSLKMGEILKSISKDHQVISITHSPPIASRADKHFFIYKEHGKDRTYTHVKEIDGKDKVHEIAKMMSGGDPPTDRAMANAEELLASAE
jgi:DNA repair protein RecN (Recombination protein N)